MKVEDKLEILTNDILKLVQVNKLESLASDVIKIIEINKKLRERNKIISAINSRLRAENEELLLRFDGINMYSLNDEYPIKNDLRRDMR